MIYYPLETLAGMGIREVMVIVGGKSVGDIVELLADGRPLRARPDVPLPARGAGHRARHRPRARLHRRRRVLRGPGRQHPPRRRRSRTWPRVRAGACGAGTLLYRVPDPQRFGVAELDAAGNVIGFEEKPEQPKSRPHPHRRVLPPPGRLRCHRPPGAVGPRRVRDHRRPQPLHPRRPPVHEGLRRAWADAGTVPSLLRAAALASDDDEAGRLTPPVARPGGDRPRDRLPPAARHGRRRVHRQRVRPPGPGA